jgi:hypothetical protein
MKFHFMVVEETEFFRNRRAIQGIMQPKFFYLPG